MIADSTAVSLHFATCDCCRLTEECTPLYIQSIRDRFGGKWICGLCAEAVKDEVVKKGLRSEEAMEQHLKFCNEVRGGWGAGAGAGVDLIGAMSRVLRRGLVDREAGFRV